MLLVSYRSLNHFHVATYLKKWKRRPVSNSNNLGTNSNHTVWSGQRSANLLFVLKKLIRETITSWIPYPLDKNSYQSNQENNNSLQI